MATINYKCDTCKREIELVENKQGLSTFGNCTITKNCMGFLYKTKRNPNNVRQSIPKYDRDLEDHTSRDLFKRHIQEIATLTWNIQHGFGISCVVIVYDDSNNIIDPDDYILQNFDGYSTITFNSATSGQAHVLTRTGGSTSLNTASVIVEPFQVSYNNILTFAIPRYITRLSSGSSPRTPTPSVTPTPSFTPINPQPLDSCASTIKIEIEVTKPNEPAVVCTETLDDILSALSPWFGWSQVLIKNRKHYCLKSLDIAKLKVFNNINNNQQFKIPDGTTFKILRISYGVNEILVNIPDRGLLLLLANSPFSVSDKETNKLIDCGEMVNNYVSEFTFKDSQLFSDISIIENTYPKITKYQ